MRPVVEYFGGREVELTLDLAALDQIAATNPQFGVIMASLEREDIWEWPEVSVILRCALRPHKISLSDVVETRGATGCKELARRVFAAAMRVEEGNGQAAAKGGETVPSPSATSSETA